MSDTPNSLSEVIGHIETGDQSIAVVSLEFAREQERTIAELVGVLQVALQLKGGWKEAVVANQISIQNMRAAATQLDRFEKDARAACAKVKP